MALNQPDRVTVNKAAKAAEVKVTYSQSLGSVYVGVTKYTDLHNTLNKINGKK